jgi:hypothetical protein
MEVLIAEEADGVGWLLSKRSTGVCGERETDRQTDRQRERERDDQVVNTGPLYPSTWGRHRPK